MPMTIESEKKKKNINHSRLIYFDELLFNDGLNEEFEDRNSLLSSITLMCACDARLAKKQKKEKKNLHFFFKLFETISESPIEWH